jgi:hypothetical protein
MVTIQHRKVVTRALRSNFRLVTYVESLPTGTALHIVAISRPTRRREYSSYITVSGNVIGTGVLPKAWFMEADGSKTFSWQQTHVYKNRLIEPQATLSMTLGEEEALKVEVWQSQSHSYPCHERLDDGHVELEIFST